MSRTDRITELSPDEWARVDQAREAALRRVMIDGVPLEEFKAAAAACYAAIGEDAPAVVVAPSPIVALMWSAIIRTSQLRGQLDGQLGGQLDGQLAGQLRGQLDGQLAGQLGGQLHDQLDGQLGGQLDGQLRDQLRGQLDGQLAGQLLRDQLRDQLDGQLGGQLDGQLRDQLRGQLAGQLAGQLLRDPLRDQLYGQLRGQLDGQLAGQLGGQLHDQLYGQLAGQLHDQLDGQLGDQLDGVHWSGWRHAWFTHWLHVATIPQIKPPPAETLKLAHAYHTITVPAFTIPLRHVVIGLGPHINCTMNDGLLHNETGAAWSWIDGYKLHMWRGTRVPEWVITDPTPERIQAESNTEIRRCAIESYGWANYLTHIDATMIDIAADPGNPGHMLELYDVPAEHQPYPDPTRVLVMDNASLDRDGSRRRFAETVPASIGDAVSAAAWQFDVSPEVYRQLERAT